MKYHATIFSLPFSYDYVTSSRSNVIGAADEPHYEFSDHSTQIADGHGTTATTAAAANVQSGLSPAPRYETNESFIASNSTALPSPSQHYAVSYVTPGITQSRNFMEVNSCTVYVCMHASIVNWPKILVKYSGSLV